MRYSDNTIIISEYREAFRKYARSGIIDMDAHLKHPFSFQIHRLEDIVLALEGTIPPYRQSQLFITLVKKGKGEKSIGHYRFPIQTNSLLVVPQRVPHSGNFFSLDCSGYMLSFDVGFFSQHFFPKCLIANKRIFGMKMKPFVTLTSEETERLGAIFEHLLQEYTLQLPHKDEMIAAKVLELLLRCDRLFAHATLSHYHHAYNDIIESFSELVQKHCKKEKSVAFYADALHIHPNYLNFLMKKYTGMTAKQTIADHLFLEAKGHLSSSSLSIKEISSRLGFTSADCFSSFFKKMSEQSPSAYRRQLRR